MCLPSLRGGAQSEGAGVKAGTQRSWGAQRALTQERAEIRLRGLPRTANGSGQPQARGAAPALRPSPEAAETRPGHGEPSTAPVSAAHSPVVKDHVSNNGAQRPARGVGARCHHTARQPTPAPRQARACASCPPARTVPAPEVRQHRGPPGTPYCSRWLPDYGGRPAGAQRGRALTQESCGSTLRSLARREERPQRERGRPNPC